MTVPVSLTPLSPALAHSLRQVTVAPDQVVFSGQPAAFIYLNDPAIDIHVMRYGDQVAGMFRIDRAYHTHYPFADPATFGLRTFLVDQTLQGRGIATATLRLLQAYLRDHYRDANAIYLTVNLRNPVARKVYLDGGFHDTAQQWQHGPAGPQHILKLDLGV